MPLYARRHTIGSQSWYECNSPADDPVITCFLAPEWMGLSEDAWLCSDSLKSEDKLDRNSYFEDSY